MTKKREYTCPACGTLMTVMAPPNEIFLRCHKDSWINEIETYDEWVKWYDAYHNNPDCKHEEVVFSFIHDIHVYKENASYEVTFGCSCKKCFHHVNVKVSKADLSQFLTKFRVEDKR